MAFWSFDPFAEMARMQRNMNRVFGTFFDRQETPKLDAPASLPASEQQTAVKPSDATPSRNAVATRQLEAWFWPRVDVKESDSAITVHAELPGVKKEDIDVSVENGVLSISGQRSQEKKEENEKYHRVERSYGSFRRAFALPNSAVESDIKANYTDGVLTVEVPKTAETKPAPSKIQVQ